VEDILGDLQGGWRILMSRRLKISLLGVVAVSLVFVAACTTSSTVGEPTTPVGNTGVGNTGTSGTGTLDLPLIRWYGGPAYWDQFPVAKAAGWANPKFFPIVIWFDSVSSDAEVQDDESYGINTYIGEPTSVNYYNFADENAYVLTTLGNTPPGGKAQPGDFLADEPDSGATSADDLAIAHRLEAASPKDGRFKEINFSSNVLSNSLPAVNKANFEALVDSYAGPVSADKYYYTQPSCFDAKYLIAHIDQAHCRTSSSYGATVRAMIARVEGGGVSKPVWNFVEDLYGGPATDHQPYITPGQLEGAVMDSIINGASGILYFNQAFAGPCAGGNIIRQVQTGALPCGQSQLDAMRQVDQRIKTLAPVLNTQSYQYTFGSDLDTMLKAYQGSAYIFAMISGAAASEPGQRTFTLPPALAGATSVEVLNENRTIPVVDGHFTDNFPYEYTYHIYKVKM
jgi:hypothetical protein